MQRMTPFLEAVIAAACRRHGCTYGEVVGQSRALRIVACRQQIWACARWHNPAIYSLPRLGQYFGKHHTTIMHALRTQGAAKRFRNSRGIRQPSEADLQLFLRLGYSMPIPALRAHLRCGKDFIYRCRNQLRAEGRWPWGNYGKIRPRAGGRWAASGAGEAHAPSPP